MKCLYCDAEMESGKAVIIQTPPGTSVLTFTADEEAKKGLFKKKSLCTIVLPYQNIEGYHCPACERIILSLKDK